MLRFFCCAILLLLIFKTFSQEPALPDVISTIAEELAANESDPEPASAYHDLLSELTEDPVMINSGDQSELSRLFFLTGFQVSSLLEHLRTTGKIESIYEIADIPGFDRQVASMMAPFITLAVDKPQPGGPERFRSSLLSNLSLRSSAEDTAADAKHLLKYRFSSGMISGGLTTEKDPGEKIIDPNTSLPDFFSAHLAYTGKGFLRKVIIGDFGAGFGLGTAVNTGMRMGLSLSSPANLSARNEIRPYTSTDENNFFRGLASQVSSGNLYATVYYSSNKTDADIHREGDGFVIRSLYKSGLHITPSSLARKDALTENSYGVNLTYRLKIFNAGLTLACTDLSVPFRLPGEDPSEVFSFSGDRNRVISANYSTVLKRIILSGEISADSRRKLAMVQAVTFRLSDRFTANLLYRNYEPGFTAFHSNGPGSSASGDNLKGLLGSFTFEAARFLFISAGADIRNYPWIRYRCSAPSVSSKQEIRIKYIPSERFAGELVYSNTSSMTDQPESTGIPKQDENNVSGIRCSLKYSPAEKFSAASRLDINTSSPGSARGLHLMQDLNYSFTKIPVRLWFRHSVFNITGWLSRIYAWENDLLYSFSMPALSGNGSRSYLMVAINLKDFGEFRVKYGITAKQESPDEKAYSQELKMQLRIRF